MSDTFKALLAEQKDGATQVAIREVNLADLPAGEVLVKVAYSSLNYKDGLAVTGQGKVIRKFPLAPGIDLAGTVVESSSPDYKAGDEVVLTGWGVGESHWGGFAQMARLKAEWLVPLPAGLSLQQAMGIGTAGFTAMQCVLALEEHGLTPADPREVVVTGAAGGVGSIAVAVLAKLRYNVVASTGRAELHDYLGQLGAKQIIDRAVLAKPGKPLESERWAGAVDTVGGDTLASPTTGAAAPVPFGMSGVTASGPGAATAAVSGAPQFSQKRSSGSAGSPQAAHNRAPVSATAPSAVTTASSAARRWPGRPGGCARRDRRWNGPG